MTRVVIAGCGYVGCALADQLVAAGHEVTGVRRSSLDTVRATGADALACDVTDPDAVSDLPDADWVVFAASSGGRGAEAARRVYVDGLDTVRREYAGRENPPSRLIYTSSTGVYGDHDGGWVDETTPIDPQTDKTRVLAEAERVALGDVAATAQPIVGNRAAELTTDDHAEAPTSDEPADAIDGTVVRFAGLYGPDRYRLERYLDGPVTEGYLNMLHRDDAAGVIAHLLDTERARGEIVVAADDEPVDKWTFADWLADECGVERPPKRTKRERLAADDLSTAAERRIRASKRCRNDRLHSLEYTFQYPTFREGYRSAIDGYRESS